MGPVKEQWRKIPGCPVQYEVSSHGRLRVLDYYCTQINRWGKPMRRLQRGRIMKTQEDKDGYRRICIRGFPTVQVHRLVALAFLPNQSNKPQVNHKNGNVADNRESNLEWMTNSENHRHAYAVLGRKATVQPGKKTRLTWPSGASRVFRTAATAASYLGVGTSAVHNAVASGGRSRGCAVAYV